MIKTLKLITIALLILPTNLSAETLAITPHSWQFPKDHGIHPDYSTEWHYITGHLESQNTSRKYGYELTFFRIKNPNPVTGNSIWNSKHVMWTHFALTDVKNKKFHHFERVARFHPYQAGASTKTLDIFHAGHKLQLKNNQIHLSAKEADISLSLSFDANTPTVLQGNKGLSQKSPRKGHASHYYSMPLLTGDGTLKLPGEPTDNVRTSSWMDREFFGNTDEHLVGGWDWFALIFDDGSTLMIYKLKDENGNTTPYSSGQYRATDGTLTKITASEFTITPKKFWKSKKTKANYPINNQIQIPKLNLNIQVTADMNAQELILKKVRKMHYWEGKSSISGTHTGMAYVELVGY